MAQGKQTLFDKLQIVEKIQKIEDNRTLRNSKAVKALLFISTMLVCSFFLVLRIMDSYLENPDLSVIPGSAWTSNTVTASYSFPIYKTTAQYNTDVALAKESALPVFVLEPNTEYETKRRIEKHLAGDLAENETELALTPAFRNFWRGLAERERNQVAGRIRQTLTQAARGMLETGVANLKLSSVEKNDVIIFKKPNIQIVIKKNILFDSESYDSKVFALIDAEFSGFAAELAKAVFLKSRTPNLIFSDEMTDKFANHKVLTIPKTVGFVRKGEVIVKKGEKLTERHVAALYSYKISTGLRSDRSSEWLSYLGGIGHVMLILSLIFLYLYNIRKRIYSDNLQVAVMCSLFILVGLLSWVSTIIESPYPIEMLIILPAFSMMTGVIFDSRTSFYTTVTLSLLIAAIRGNDYITAVIMMFAGAVAAYSVRDIQNRTQMYRSIFYIFIGFLIPIVIFGIERSVPLFDIMVKSGFAVISSVVSPLVTFGLIFLIERTTTFTTDLKLQDYNNLQHPLLVQLAEKAPGTYQHSLQVSMLAEKCAVAINANALLCRVASYYHDIGKMLRPEYFVENQIGIGNKHEMLTPKKSARIIISHVTDGFKLAKDHNLPERITDVIMNHHGDTLVRHFYALAQERKAEGEVVSENDFRYPGPRPDSKEAAIIMICDSAEAMSHIKDYSPAELEEMVDNIVVEKFAEKQFDKCELTMREVETIKLTILRNLYGIGHKRIEYKAMPK